MKIVAYDNGVRQGLGVLVGEQWVDISAEHPEFPSDLVELLVIPGWKERLQQCAVGAPPLDLDSIRYLPPFQTPQKILCVGLNYVDHIAESPYPQPDYPTFFPRFASSLIAHGDNLVKPKVSDQFDYEAELVAVIGKRVPRHVSPEDALQYVAGYTVFNEASVRDYQFKAPQWTIGKNFDNTGACGPVFVTADELPLGAKGLRIQTRLNGKLEQNASIDDLIFSVADLISIASEALSLQPGDLLVTGTPAGVGFGKKPPVYMRAGDIVEVEIEGIGTLRNTVVNEE